MLFSRMDSAPVRSPLGASLQARRTPHIYDSAPLLHPLAIPMTPPLTVPPSRARRSDVHFRTDADVLAFAPKSYQPMNSQNTVFLRDALWALILPVTTLWREDDIYRGYWVQRLLWELGGAFVYTGPTAYQVAVWAATDA